MRFDGASECISAVLVNHPGCCEVLRGCCDDRFCVGVVKTGSVWVL